MSAPRHLLVRLPNPIGDAVMATPALRGLRRALPDSRITWTGGPAAQAVLEGLPHRDGVVPLAGPMAEGKRAPFRAGRFLRKIAADAALLLPNSFSSALAVKRAGIPTRVGSDLDARGTLLTQKVALPKDDAGKLLPRSMVEHYLALAAAFGAEDDGRGPEVAVTAFDEERAALRLRSVPDGAAVLGINPGAAFGETKILPAERIAAAVSKVRAGRDVFPVVFCGPGEEALARDVASAIEPPVLSCADAPPDLGELKALLRACGVLATTDTGPRHMAEALAVPTVVWMGPTDPRWSGHSEARVVRKEDLDCLACHLKTCPIGLPCMRDLDPALLAEAILALLPGG